MPKFRIGISANQLVRTEVEIEAEDETAAEGIIYAKFNEFKSTNGLYIWAEKQGNYWDHCFYNLSDPLIDYIDSDDDD